MNVTDIRRLDCTQEEEGKIPFYLCFIFLKISRTDGEHDTSLFLPPDGGARHLQSHRYRRYIKECRMHVHFEQHNQNEKNDKRLRVVI